MYHLIRSLYLHATSKEEYSIVLLGLDNAGKTTLLNQIKTLFKTDANAKGNDENEADPKAGNTVPTVGQNVTTINLPQMYIKIWDVGGQMSLRRLWTSYYKSAHAVVFVLDSTDLGTLEVTVDENDDRHLKTPTTPGSEGPRKWHGRRKSSYNVFGEGAMSPDSEKSRVTPGMLSKHAGQGRLDEARAVLESVLTHPDMSGVPILVLANKQDREDCIEVVRIKEGFVRPVFEGEKGDMVRDSRVLPVSALQGTGVREAVDWVKSRVLWNKESRPPVMR